MIRSYFLIVLSAVLFFQGFFPVSTPSTHLENDNEPPNSLKNLSFHNQYQTNFTKTILVVIDALRLDFVNPRYMPLVSRLMDNQGCFIKIKAETPTVTLPRIKALTVGNIPQFIDVVLNLANTGVLKDSIIHSAFKNDKRMVFYGDDTWLKLFPNKFTRSEGTNSFFVRDFKEVDDNVTRNVRIELGNEDWDIMILHYLGLDHIGHVLGPFSSLIPKKLNEMDNIVYEIFENLSSKDEDVLLMVTGDHGMKDSGGHGGSTFSETHVPLIIIGHNCQNTSCSQTDIPVNLAILLGLRIPSLAIGKVHKQILQAGNQDYLYALYYNSVLLKQKDSCCNDMFDEAVSYYVEYLKNSDNSKALNAIKLYENYLNVVSNNLAQVSVQQNVYSLFIGLFIMLNLLISLLSIILFPTRKSPNGTIFKSIMIGLLVVQYMLEDNTLVFCMMLVILSFILLKSVTFLEYFNLKLSHNSLNFFILVGVLHPITFISSSYVEEEHQFWYFFNTLYMFMQLVNFSKINFFSDMWKSLVCLAVFKFLRRLNSTGDKWATYPDLSDWLLKGDHFIYYQSLFIFGLLLVFIAQCILIANKRPRIVHFINAVTLVLIFIYKQKETSVTLGRSIWFLICIQLILTYRYSNIINTWILILSLLLKPYNVILVSYCVLSSLCFSKYFVKMEIIVLYHTLLGNVLYFAQGHSNSLASVDISMGYIGLSEYRPMLVIVQVMCHVQAFPVLCHLLIFRDSRIESKKAWAILCCNRLYVFFITCIVTIIFRHHLFIWSVFAPKLFIEFVHVSFLFLEYLLVQGDTFLRNRIRKLYVGKPQF